MTQRHGHRPGPVAVNNGQIGMAKPGGLYLHQYLPVTGWRQFEVFND
jgi:hypothetical protein